jgi:HAD superfamily hydrolase (TIGR01509 family)
MIKAIIFDCFGVLVGRGFDDTYRQMGGDPAVDRKFIADVLNQANRGLISQTEFRQAIIKHLDITINDYERAIQQAEQPNYELLKLIKELKKHYKTAILSNVNTGVLERKIPKLSLDECFDSIIVSAEVGYMKPQPEIYSVATKQLGVMLEECVFIDDKQLYVDAAIKVGMQGIVYDNFDQIKSELSSILTRQQ